MCMQLLFDSAGALQFLIKSKDELGNPQYRPVHPPDVLGYWQAETCQDQTLVLINQAMLACLLNE